jgi:hypothetical protein
MKLSQITPQQLNEQEEDGPNDAGFSSTQDISYAVLPHLKNEIEKLNRKAAKIGSPEIHMDVSEPFFKTIKRDGDEIEEKYVTVEVDGEAPHVPGYQFLATIQHKGTGNVIRTMPGVDESNVKNFYDAKPEYCDHCKKKRARIDTYIIRDEQTGDLRQIGRNCLADFLGGKDPKQMLWWFSLKDRVDNIMSNAENYEGKLRGRSEYAASRDRVLKVAASIIDEYGYLSYNAAGYGEDTTSSIVKQLIFNQRPLNRYDVEKYDQWMKVAKDFGPKQEAYLEKVTNWFENEVSDDEKQNNNFYHNIDVIYNSDHITWRDVGYLVAIFPAYERAKGEQDKQKKEKKSNEWIGNPGDKLPKTRVKVVKTMIKTVYFGYNEKDQQLVKMEDDAGNSFTWWNGSRKRMEDDTTYDIMGTIKKHDEYRGRKTTVLLRVKFEEV